MKKNGYVSLVCLFLLIAIISAVMIYNHYEKANENENLYNNLISQVEDSKQENKQETV